MTRIETLANRWWAAANFTVATFWLGLLIGVEFLATPAKFSSFNVS